MIFLDKSGESVIYLVENGEIRLLRIGTHAQLFG